MDRLWLFFGKMRGRGRTPLKVVRRNVIIGFIGGFVAVGMLAILNEMGHGLWIMAPFGASCVLAFGVWDSPLSQPRNIIGGHIISTFTGLLVYHLVGGGFLSMAIGVGAAISFMMLARMTHPPAGADPLVVIMAGSSWSFLLTPVLIGAVIIVAAALIINNLDRTRNYPTFWW
ncbi:HPP family protein [Paenibacillus sp. SN-8-1]|uniref:HPP family protein n=1 Tax=Paenibacillus sp. SN-8-1 TaxID=3435409 RepID=UPI003D9AA919